MNVVVGGGTGFVGRHLTRQLVEHGFRPIIVSRQAGPGTITWSDLSRMGLPKDTVAVVSLQGQVLVDFAKRFTPTLQDELRSSRIDTTQALVEASLKAHPKPKAFISISGVGFYPPSPTAEYTESSPGGSGGFIEELSRDWEDASSNIEQHGIRRVIVRSGLVLGKDGGYIKAVGLQFYLGFGGRVGSGKQWLPWIHVDDVAGIITHSITNDEVVGILNGVAPQIATNADLTRAIARAMWRPAVCMAPASLFKWLLGPERAKVILEGQKVIPNRTLQSGYKYQYPDLESACKACF